MTPFRIRDIIGATSAEVFGAERTECVQDVVTDTRKIAKGALFVALKGERFNGENFVAEAIERGAFAVLVSKVFSADETERLAKKAAVLKVADTQKAYQQIGHLWREQFKIPVIAITGSNGKTTTKDLTAAVLSARGKVCKTQANFNNEIGLPLTLLSITKADTVAVVEIGMRGLHQIEALAPIADPSIGIVTNVGETHMELLGSLENIARAKGELVEAIGKDGRGGTVILNADNAFVAKMREKARPGVKVVTFGIENAADVRALVDTIETVSGSATRFAVEYAGERHVFEIKMVGRHNVMNALAAIAAGIVLGFSADEIEAGLKNLEATKMRFEVEEVKGYHIINDAYNASPMSMKAALETLARLTKGRKIAVLGDMFELGSVEREAHEAVGREAAMYGFSAVVTRGKLGKCIADGARKAGVKDVYSAESHEAAAELLKKILQKGDTVLFKGSRGMAMEKIIPLL